MSYYYFSFFLCGIVAYLILSDPNILKAIELILKLTSVQYQKIKWMILNDPRNPIVKYLIWRRSYKIAKEIESELNKN